MNLVGKLLYDMSWGFGIVTEKVEHDRYEVTWLGWGPEKNYTCPDSWVGESDRLYIVKYDAKRLLK